jgi:prepilin-type N-terminal cleavage/methylation domain-containing protein
MMRRIQRRLGREEKGFTLIEVLIVMIVIGLLAAIAYAVFIGQRTKAKDAEAKDNVAALSVDVESCRADSEDFTVCKTAADLKEDSLPIDAGASVDPTCDTLPPTGPAPATPPGAGQVAVTAADVKCYVIIAQTDDGHFFWQWRPPEESAKRACTPAGQGGCQTDADSGDPTVGSW